MFVALSHKVSARAERDALGDDAHRAVAEVAGLRRPEVQVPGATGGHLERQRDAVAGMELQTALDAAGREPRRRDLGAGLLRQEELERASGLGPHRDHAAWSEPVVGVASCRNQPQAWSPGRAVQVEDQLMPHAAHAAQLDGGGVGLDEERSGLRPAVDEQRPVTRDSNLLRREPIDRRTAKQQEALDGGVPEELLPRLLLARAGRSQEVDRAEV